MNTRECELQVQTANVRSRIAHLETYLQAPKRISSEPGAFVFIVALLLTSLIPYAHSVWSADNVQELRQDQEQCEAQVAMTPVYPKVAPTRRADCDCSPF